MRVFVTGGTGLIGSAVVAGLLANGHTVLALARSDESARAAEGAGAEPLRKSLTDLDTLRAGVAAGDGVIHLAFAKLEQAEAGTTWHAVADEGDRVRDIAAVIGRRLGVPVQSMPAETYGPLGAIFAADQPSSSAHMRQALGWTPTHPSLLEDLEEIQP